MKILFITFPLAFQSPGGGEQIILYSKKALELRGHEVDLFDPWKHKVTDYDLVHYFSCLTWWDWKAIKSYEVPLVVTPTLWPDKSFLIKRLELFKDFLRLRLGSRETFSLRGYLKYPDVFLPATTIESSLLESFYDIPVKKLITIGNGVDAPKIISNDSNAFTKEVGLKDFILFSGSIRPNKNIDKLILACQKLRLNLVIMGEASFGTQEYEQYCRKIAGKETVFIGFKEKGSRLYDEIYNAAKLVAIPSDFETFCLAAAEAAAIGKPIVVPRVGGTTCVYGDDAYYLENPQSLSSLCEVLEKVISEDSQVLKEKGVRIAASMKADYSWNSVAQKLEDTYSRLI